MSQTPVPGARARALVFMRTCAARLATPNAAWTGAAIAAAAAAVIVVIAHAWPLNFHADVTHWGALLYVLWLLGKAAALALVLVLGVRLLCLLPLRWLIAVAMATAVVAPLFKFFASDGWRWYAAAWLLLPASLVGAGLGALLSRRTTPSSGRARIIATASLLLGAGTLAWATAWMVGPGDAVTPRVIPASALAPLDAPDPAMRGPYAFEAFTYGAGDDRHRPEYADGVALRTPRVDGSRLVEWGDRAGELRRRFWGFDTTRLPMQGRVWMPQGEGPFPLVMAVHGNHQMEHFSDAGYGYLGELLASRGFIFVSVDQNFLNSGIADLPQGKPDDENDARAWLLLEHLRQWHTWNDTAGHRLAGKMDPDRIALIGHSRGGEAVAVAAAFNRMGAYPDDGTIAFDYGYGIRAVAALAPVDGQYRPGGVGTPLHDVSYFTLQGSQDGDMFSFDGARQAERVHFSGNTQAFRSALHFGGGNHGQFNTDWGRYDITPPFGWLLNIAPLMPAPDQRRIAEVFVSAFLATTLHDDVRYLPLFREPQRGATWLPDTVYAAEFAMSGSRIVAGYDEDIDPTTGTWPGTRIGQQGLSDWKETRVSLRRGLREMRAAYLGWRAADATTHYEIALPDGDIADGMVALRFSLADSGATPTPGAATDTDAADAGAAPAQDGIDLHVRLTDRAGNTAMLPLSHHAALPRIDRPALFKSPRIRPTPRPEPAFQTYAFPLDDFVIANPAFERNAIASIAFVFDRTHAGVVLLHGVGFEPAWDR